MVAPEQKVLQHLLPFRHGLRFLQMSNDFGPTGFYVGRGSQAMDSICSFRRAIIRGYQL